MTVDERTDEEIIEELKSVQAEIEKGREAQAKRAELFDALRERGWTAKAVADLIGVTRWAVDEQRQRYREKREDAEYAGTRFTKAELEAIAAEHETSSPEDETAEWVAEV